MAEEEKDEKLYERDVTFKVLRFDPDKDTKPYTREYKLTAKRGMTVLDGLMQIKETQDPTLSYRKSCRMGICGSCGMYINSKPALACQTQISELGPDEIEVRPLPNFPIIRDVVSDLSLLFEKHTHLKPHIVREDKDEMDNPTGEYLQTPEELERYLQFSYCIKCGCCVAACPTSSTDEAYLGPQALGQAYRYVADTRDDGFLERMERVDDVQGIWRCHFAGSCSEACPKGVDPAFAIQLYKREIAAYDPDKKRKPAALEAGPIKNAKRRPEVPDAPAKTAGR